MKMKKTDIGVVALMYAVCAAFYIASTKLKPGSETYPRFCICLLFGLTTVYVVQMAVNAKKHGVVSGKDEIFEGFMPKQFFVSLGAAIAFLLLIYVIGFYPAASIFMIGLLWFLQVPWKHIAIVVVAMDLLIFGVFTKFLMVKLPMGLIFG